MAVFAAKSICILGRQPAFGLAELESVYGPDHVLAFSDHALLDIPADEIEFMRLGGVVKTARILKELPYSDFQQLIKFLIDEIPNHMQNLPDKKFTFGLSLYGLKAKTTEINSASLEIKKNLKKERSVRVVPNKTLALSSAQVLHNKLTHQGGWELLLASDGRKTFLAQTLFVQDINAYSSRDQARPKRDPRIGMLPPKLAQIIINLAAPAGSIDKSRVRILDPFCGTGVILQEALLMGYNVIGTDRDSRMVEASKQNIQWLYKKYPSLEGQVVIEQADATGFAWPTFSAVASETYLGPPLTRLPDKASLQKIISEVDNLLKNFLRNLAAQPKIKDRKICLAVPAWREPNGNIIHLPVIDRLTDMGYTYSNLKHVRGGRLIYYREDQIVARQLLRLRKL